MVKVIVAQFKVESKKDWLGLGTNKFKSLGRVYKKLFMVLHIPNWTYHCGWLFAFSGVGEYIQLALSFSSRTLVNVDVT